jgi:hypothetical protein
MAFRAKLLIRKDDRVDLGIAGKSTTLTTPASPKDRTTSPTKTTCTIYVLRVSGRVWTPVVLSDAGGADAKDLGVRYANGVSLTRVTNNPSLGQYTFCRGVYSFNPYDTDNKLILFSQWNVS